MKIQQYNSNKKYCRKNWFLYAQQFCTCNNNKSKNKLSHSNMDPKYFYSITIKNKKTQKI